MAYVWLQGDRGQKGESMREIFCGGCKGFLQVHLSHEYNDNYSNQVAPPKFHNGLKNQFWVSMLVHEMGHVFTLVVPEFQCHRGRIHRVLTGNQKGNHIQVPKM